MTISTFLSISTLNTNGLNAQWQKVTEWIFKKKYIYAHYKNLTSDLKRHKPKVMAWVKALHANRNAKRDGVAMFIWDKIDFKTKHVMRDKEFIT